MSKKTITITLLIVGLILLSFDSVSNALVGFLLAGVIPGTHIIVPFWAMVGIWCLVITAVATSYIEAIFALSRSEKPAKKSSTSHLPRRRYNQI